MKGCSWGVVGTFACLFETNRWKRVINLQNRLSSYKILEHCVHYSLFYLVALPLGGGGSFYASVRNISKNGYLASPFKLERLFTSFPSF
jgi:hypothetical protein